MPKKSAGLEKKSSPSVDLDLAGGEIFCIPLKSIGFVTGVVSRSPHPETALVHIYIRMELTSAPFDGNDMGCPTDWPLTWIGLTSSRALLNKRWPIMGKVPGFDPLKFPVPPTRYMWSSPTAEANSNDLCSIQTMLDEPSLQPISNEHCMASEALLFPEQNIILQASSLENSLVKYFRKMGFSFHDIPMEGIQVRASDIDLWNSYACKRREEFDPIQWATYLPVGKKTDRGLKPGDWLAFPMVCGGYGVAMLVEKPQKHLRFFSDAFVLSMRKRWEHWPTIDDVSELTANDGATLSQLSMIVVRDGHWRVIGSHSNFKKEEWPWPYPWFHKTIEGKEILSISVGKGLRHDIQIDRDVLALDPEAGKVMLGTMNAGSFAFRTHLAIAGMSKTGNCTVTPERLSAWVKINQKIDEALAIIEIERR